MLTIKTKPDCTLGFLNVISETLTEYQIINGINLAKISEEQARELVYGHPEDYEKSPEYGKSGLNKLALSVGIEEKDFGNYLVVKL
jgi:hypothetical protein